MSTTVTKDDLGHVNILAGLGNIAGTIVSSIESSIAVVKSPKTPITEDPNTVNDVLTKITTPTVTVPKFSTSALFNSVADAQNAVAEIRELISDIEAKRYTEAPEDVIKLLKTIFAILAKFGINVPFVSAVVALLPDLNPV